MSNPSKPPRRRAKAGTLSGLSAKKTRALSHALLTGSPPFWFAAPLLRATALAPETSGSIYSTARDAVKPWKDPRIERATSKCDITLAWLLSGNNTLYVIAPPDQPERFAAALGGLIADLVSQAFASYNWTGEPLDPSLLLMIDEAANAKLRDLPDWASTVSGVGIQLVTIWQSIAQIEQHYGIAAQSVLTNHLSKLFFGGMSDLPALESISSHLGSEYVVQRHSSVDPPTDHAGRVAFAPPDALRRLQRSRPLLLHGNRLPSSLLGDW